MGNEFKIKKGFISEGDSRVDGTLSAETVNINVTPTNNNSLTKILGVNSSTGNVEYKDASSFGGGGGGGSNTFVTGGTISANTLTLDRNDGNSVTVSGITGYEPYVRQTFTAPLQINNDKGRDQYTYKNLASGADNYAVPFIFQQNIKLNGFRVYTNTNSSQGRFAVYKYNGTNVGINAQFGLEYEENLSTLTAGLNTVTISTPFTFTAGDVYFVIYIPSTATSVYTMVNTGNNDAYRWQQNKFFGNLSNYQRYVGGIITSLALTGGGNCPATIDLEPNREALFGYEYMEIAIINT